MRLAQGELPVSAPDPLQLALDETTWWMPHPFTHAITELAHARRATDALRDEHHDVALAVLRHAFQRDAVIGERERGHVAKALFARAGLGTLEIESPPRRASSPSAAGMDGRVRARGTWLHGMLAAAESRETGDGATADPVAAAFVAAVDDALNDRELPTARSLARGADARHGGAVGFECSLDTPRGLRPEPRAGSSTQKQLDTRAVARLLDRNGVIQAFGMLMARRFATADLRTLARLCATDDPMMNSAVREIARATSSTVLRQLWDSPERESIEGLRATEPAARATAACVLLHGLRWGHCKVVEMRAFRAMSIHFTLAWSSRLLQRPAEAPIAWAQGCALGIGEHAHGLRSSSRTPAACHITSTDTGTPGAVVVTLALPSAP
jgi:hypothetical protein